jgi:flavin reductase (DIM6/NTAB) family NADH-FMN oxidoreductase RutF
VAPLGAGDRQLADRFAGVLPSPGGLFRQDEWRDTGYGPVLATGSSWAGCRLEQARPYGWGMLVEASIEQVELGPGEDPLVYYRGRYRRLD